MVFLWFSYGSCTKSPYLRPLLASIFPIFPMEFPGGDGSRARGHAVGTVHHQGPSSADFLGGFYMKHGDLISNFSRFPNGIFH